MADVLFRMDADTAKAVQGVLKLAEAQGKTETAAKKTAKSLSSIEKMGKQAGDAIKGMALGMVGFQTISQSFQSHISTLKEASAATRTFEGEMTGLLSLGDNIKFGTKIKDQVLSMSNATGRARSEIADLMFAAQSSADNLSKDLQGSLVAGSLDVSKLTGEGAPETLRLLVKTWQTYGDQVKDVTDLQNKLILAAEMGDTTFADLAARLPEVNSAAKAVGISFDQVLAALISLTQKQGDVGKAFTQLRNFFLMSEKAFNSGLLKNTGDFVTNLQQIGTLNSEQLLKIFGTENLSGAKDLASSVADIANNLKTIEATSGNIAKEKTFERFADPSYRAADTAAKVEQIMQNNNLATPEAAKRTNELSHHQMQMDLIKDQLPGWAKWAASEEHPLANMVLKSAYGIRGTDNGVDNLSKIREYAAADIKQAQFDEGTSDEDIALYRAQQRNRAAREAAGSKPGANGSEPPAQSNRPSGSGLFGSDSWEAPPQPWYRAGASNVLPTSGLPRSAPGNVIININHANFATPASAIREMNAKVAGLPAGI